MPYVYQNIALGLEAYLSFFPFFVLTFVLMAGTLVPLGLIWGAWELSTFRRV